MKFSKLASLLLMFSHVSPQTLLRGFCLTFGAVFSTSQLTAQEVNLLPDSTAARIDQVFAGFMNKTPGCVLGIGQSGKIVYARGYGMANLEHNVPLTPLSVSDPGSVAKQFTAAAVLLLAQDGKLSLDDDIRKYIPELPDFGRTITIRHMLNHSSGMRDLAALFAYTGRAAMYEASNDDVFQLAIRQKTLNFAPGEEHLYSNTPYQLMTLLVSRLAGMSFAEFTDRRIFKPLGMNSTQWRTDYAKTVDRRAAGYVASAPGAYRAALQLNDLHGGGGLLITIGDLMKWSNTLAQPSAQWREIVRQMESPSRLNDSTAINYGLGLSMDRYRGVREIGHGGFSRGYRASLVRYPDHGLSIGLLCNVDVGQPLVPDVVDILLRKDLEPVPSRPGIRVPEQQLRSLAGIYHDARTGAVLRLHVRGDTLLAGGPPGGMPLIPTRQDGRVFQRLVRGTAASRFFGSSPQGTFEFTGTGAGMRAILTTPYGKTTYQRVAPFSPSTQQLQEFAGTYVSPELGVTWRVLVEKGQLVMRYDYLQHVELEPTLKDAFAATAPPRNQFTFTRDAQGRIDGFEVYAGRVRHLRFDRR